MAGHAHATRGSGPPRRALSGGLYALKPWFVRRLVGAEELLVAHGVSADAVTGWGVAAGVLAGAAVALGALLELPVLWLLVPPLALARLALNALDGSVARRTGTARPFGSALNEVADRLSDAAMIGSLALVSSPALAAAAVACAFLCSLTGVLGQVAGGSRLTGGPMGKADRVAVVAAAAVIAAPAGSGAPFTVALVVVATGSLLTAAKRLRVLRGRR